MKISRRVSWFGRVAKYRFGGFPRPVDQSLKKNIRSCASNEAKDEQRTAVVETIASCLGNLKAKYADLKSGPNQPWLHSANNASTL